MGHMAIGLLFTLPVWFIWDRYVSLAFISFTLATVMLPDVDIVLRRFIPTVQHHGVTHTVLFVAAVALVAGTMAVTLLWPHVKGWAESRGFMVTKRGVYLFATGGLLLGGLSHLFGDMLSAPDIAQPVEPLWPFLDKPVSVDVLYYSSIWWNLGLLVVAIVAHVILLYYSDTPVEHSYRIERA